MISLVVSTYVVRVVVKQLSEVARNSLCITSSVRERDRIGFTYHFINYITHFLVLCGLRRIRLTQCIRSCTLTRRVEAVVPWHSTVPEKASEFVCRNAFLYCNFFYRLSLTKWRILNAGGRLAKHTAPI